MLMERDREILRFVEKYGGITINQCAKMFFSKSNQSYQLARKRLRKISSEMNLLKFYTNKLTNEKVYCLETNKRLTPHRIYLLNIYATLIENGCKMLGFTKEPEWLDGTYRSDGLFKIEYNGTKRMILAEIDVMHDTNIEKYEIINESNEIQRTYGIDVFPIVIIVTDSPNKKYSENFDIVYLDYNLNGLVEKVLA